jgi:hypothetical protein
MRVCSTSTTVTCGLRKILMISVDVDLRSVSVSAFGLVLSGTLSHCHGPLSSTWQVDCSMVSLFSWNCLAGLLEDVPLAVRQRLSAHYGKVSDSGWTWLIQEGGLDVEMWRTDCMASSIIGSNSNGFFLWGHLKERVYAVPSRTIKDHKARLKTAVSGRCQHVKSCLRECRVAHCFLPWNGRRLLRASVVTTGHSWFDHVIACAIWHWHVSSKLNVAGLMLYNILAFFFLRIHTMESEFCFTLYTHK